MSVEDIPEKIQRLYQVVFELEEAFPGRRFTLDGHLIGSIGEVLAEHHFGLLLFPGSTETHDAKSPCGKRVQIKATQGKSVGIRSEPEHLIVLKILSTGKFKTVYNGPGQLAWDNSGKMQKNGQRGLSVSKLEELMKEVAVDQQLTPVSQYRHDEYSREIAFEAAPSEFDQEEFVMRFSLGPDRWYAAEIIGEEFEKTIRSYSPIKVRRIVSEGKGGRFFLLDFYHANYPEGVREKRYHLKTIERNKEFILAVSTEDNPRRYFLIHPINVEWLKNIYHVDFKPGMSAEDWLERYA